VGRNWSLTHLLSSRLKHAKCLSVIHYGESSVRSFRHPNPPIFSTQVAQCGREVWSLRVRGGSRGAGAVARNKQNVSASSLANEGSMSVRPYDRSWPRLIRRRLICGFAATMSRLLVRAKRRSTEGTEARKLLFYCPPNPDRFPPFSVTLKHAQARVRTTGIPVPDLISIADCGAALTHFKQLAGRLAVKRKAN
jgi:hypothetical protein